VTGDSHLTAPLSVPRRPRAPRRLEDSERRTLVVIADALIPRTGSHPAASSAPDFQNKIDVALDARSDAFSVITARLAVLADVPDGAMLATLEALAGEDPATFQAISTVVAGAWLLTGDTRNRIGYHGPKVDKAGLEEAVDELTSGILDPVLEKYDHDSPRWIR
jgi:hypothetical protein